jgi:hypothetical protein
MPLPPPSLPQIPCTWNLGEEYGFKSSFFQRKKLLLLVLSVFVFQNGEMPGRAEGQKNFIKKVLSTS